MPNPKNGLAKCLPPPFQDFVAGLSVILRGTIDDRLNWAFNLYDLNKDGCITKEVQGHGGQGGGAGGWGAGWKRNMQRHLLQKNGSWVSAVGGFTLSLAPGP